MVITHHNYEQYLGEAILSVLNQTSVPTEIIVIDDYPTNKSEQIVNEFKKFGVKYYQAKFSDPLKSRKYGHEVSSSEYISFLDADDIMCPYYIQQGLNALQENPDSDIIFSDIQYFNDNGLIDKIEYSHDIPRKRIFQTNFLHVGCITKRSSIDEAGAFHHEHDTSKCHEDWLFWRAMIKNGCSIAKQRSYYLARKHRKNRSDETERSDYRISRGIDISSVTYAAKIDSSDNLYVLNDWNHDASRLVINLFGPIRISLLPSDLEYDIAWVKDNSLKSIINHLKRSSTTDYIFLYDEDNPPQPGIINKMFDSMDHDVAIVQGSKYPNFLCTLIVTETFRDYCFTDNHGELPSGKNERVIYI